MRLMSRLRLRLNVLRLSHSLRPLKSVLRLSLTLRRLKLRVKLMPCSLKSKLKANARKSLLSKIVLWLRRTLKRFSLKERGRNPSRMCLPTDVSTRL